MQDFLSNENRYCEGFFATGRKNHLLGVYLSAAKKKKMLSHDGSTQLDEINAFDQAEVDKANFGQINMIKVSSFCGPRGYIWGYDLCLAPKEPYIISPQSDFNFPVFGIDGLRRAFHELVGTIDQPRFPFLPGSHVPCASKCYTKTEKGKIYAAVAIGVPADRTKHACLFMEDVGEVPCSQENNVCYDNLILWNMIKSVFEIGKNQKIEYKEVLVGMESVVVEDGEVGCALIASPYFLLAKDAYPLHVDLFDVTLGQWLSMV